MNTFGNFFRITSFGESHGTALGVIIDGCPPQIELSESDIQHDLDRRAPGQSTMTTPRKESDTCQILSGVFKGKTTGTPITIVVYNENQKSADYEHIKDIFRPSHADFSYEKKYGIRDYRGGGRASARETVARVMAGAVAKKILQKYIGTEIYGFTRGIGTEIFSAVDKNFIEKNPLRMADPSHATEQEKRIEQLKKEGDSIGGVVEIRAENVAIGLGSPVFGKLEALLAAAVMSVPGTKAFEIGEGFGLCTKIGSDANDPWQCEEKKFHTVRNANGGILGGISTGEHIWFRVGIKATSSIGKSQKTADKQGIETDVQISGRHDPILLPRAVPVLEAMTALVLVDQWMWHQAQCGN